MKGSLFKLISDFYQLQPNLGGRGVPNESQLVHFKNLLDSASNNYNNDITISSAFDSSQPDNRNPAIQLNNSNTNMIESTNANAIAQSSIDNQNTAETAPQNSEIDIDNANNTRNENSSTGPNLSNNVQFGNNNYHNILVKIRFAFKRILRKQTDIKILQ